MVRRVPSLGADFEIVETGQYESGPPLDVAILSQQARER
jgi:hypothetical protein